MRQDGKLNAEQQNLLARIQERSERGDKDAAFFHSIYNLVVALSSRAEDNWELYQSASETDRWG